MKFILFLFSLNVFFVYSQSYSVVKDTSTTVQGNLSIKYTISGVLADIQSVELREYKIIDGDTNAVFEGYYNLEIDNPKDFKTFVFDEDNGVLMFGLGEFMEGVFVGEIKINKLIGVPEEYNFN